MNRQASATSGGIISGVSVSTALSTLGSTGRDSPAKCDKLFRDAARDVAALLSHLGIGRVTAVGVSGGGIVLLHMATAASTPIDDVAFTPRLLSTIAANTLIVFGDRDPLYPVSLAFDEWGYASMA